MSASESDAWCLRNVSLLDGQQGQDLWIESGRIRALGPNLPLPAGVPTIEAQGHLLSPPFIDAHFHLDAVLTRGLPRVNASGTLQEGIAVWGELKPQLTQDALVERALRYCDWAVAKGVLGMRTHVDVCDDRLLAVEALLHVRRLVSPYFDLQLVAFPQDGVLRGPSALANLERALDMGVDVVGGAPHLECTPEQGAQSVRILCELAAQRGLRVDMHCDENDDPHSRHIESLVSQTQRLGLQGRVTGSHLTSMHSMDDEVVSQLLPKMAQAQLHVVANPLINITLQGRRDAYPKRRGMARVPELLAAGVNVGFGHDCALDPWYALGSADMLEVAHMGLHVAHMTSVAQMRSCFDAVTVNNRRVMGLPAAGFEVGAAADFVLLQARDAIEAIRLRATRLLVVRRGAVLAKSAMSDSHLQLPNREVRVDWSWPP